MAPALVHALSNLSPLPPTWEVIVQEVAGNAAVAGHGPPATYQPLPLPTDHVLSHTTPRRGWDGEVKSQASAPPQTQSSRARAVPVPVSPGGRTQLVASNLESKALVWVQRARCQGPASAARLPTP